jgi:hypothetical protein
MTNLVRPITRRDIKGPAMYAHIRDDYRHRLIEIKKARRVFIGDIVELVFDNRFTLTMQIEEEIRINNELMPTDTSLAGCLFVALPHDDPKTPERMHDLVGLDEHVILTIGPHAIRASFEPGRSTAEKISAVQYTRYPLSAEAKQALLTPGTPIIVEIDHPKYRHRVQCSEDLRASLAADYGD